MLVREFVVKLQNKPGELLRVVGILSDNNIDLKAVTCIKVSNEETKVKIITIEYEKTREILQKNNIEFYENKVVIVDIEDKPGELARILKVLANKKMNIEYVYTTFSYVKKRVLVVFDFSEPEKALEILKENNVDVVTILEEDTISSHEHDIKEYLSTIITP